MHKPQFIGPRLHSARRRGQRTHVLDTEVRELEEAVEILLDKAIRKRQAATRKLRPLTFREELGRAKTRSWALKNSGQISLALGGHSKNLLKTYPVKVPDLYKSLSFEDKQRKIRELYASGAFKPLELAIKFGLPVHDVKVAIWGEPPPDKKGRWA